MNYKNIVIFFVVMAFTFVAFAIEGECKAKARVSRRGKCYAYTYAKCKGQAGKKKDKCKTSGSCPKECESYANCLSSGVRAYAKAWKVNSIAYGLTFAVIWAWSGHAKADAGQSGIIDSNFVAVDTTTLELDIAGSDALLTLTGKMNALPGMASKLIVEAFQNDDEAQVIFTGKAVVAGNTGELEVTGFDTTNFDVTYSGDTTIVEFDFTHDPIPYSGSADSVGILLTADALAGVEMPALSQYALIILVILVVGSGIWLMLRKRRAVRV